MVSMRYFLTASLIYSHALAICFANYAAQQVRYVANADFV